MHLYPLYDSGFASNVLTRPGPYNYTPLWYILSSLKYTHSSRSYLYNNVSFFIFMQTSETYSTSITLSSLDAVNVTFNCSTSSPGSGSPESVVYDATISSERFNEGYFIVDLVCLSSSVMYRLTLENSGSLNTPIFIDSVSIVE